MELGLVILNRILSSVFGILMINHFFNPRGEREKTNQVMYGSILLEAVIVVGCYFYGSYLLLFLVETIIVAGLFFSFYPLFYADSVKWMLTYFVLTDINIFITGLVSKIVEKMSIEKGNGLTVYCSFRIIAFLVAAVIVLSCDKKLPEKLHTKKHSKSLSVIFSIVTVFFIQVYFLDLYQVLKKSNEEMPKILFSTCAVLVFVIICFFFYFIMKESMGKQDQMEYEHNENLLRVATNGLEQRIKAVEVYVEKLRVINHDRRHFNAMLLELLNQGEVEKAKELLKKESSRTTQLSYRWCDNPTVNAAIGHYLSIAQEKGISLVCKIDVPKDIEYDTIGFSMMLGNLIENAIQACEQKKTGEKVIWIKVMYQGQFLIELENTIEKEVEFDNRGFPLSKRSGHGFGTKSVEAFVKENNGEIVYSAKNKRFTVRIILP